MSNQHKRGLIDLSSLIWTSLKFGSDPETNIIDIDSKGREKKVNGWQWGYDHAVQYILDTMNDLDLQPSNLIICVEGENSKLLRRSIYPDYKAGRDKMEKDYEQFNLAKQAFIKAFTSIGASAVTQEGIETDDVIGYLSKALEGEVWIISGDKDLAQCIGGNVHQYRRGVRDENPLGPFPHEFIPVYLCLVGDTDEMPGAAGFGKGAFSKVMEAFGVDCLPALRDLIVNRQLDKLAEDVDQCKVLQKILDDQQSVYMCWDLARLHYDRVNTQRRPLRWTVGMVKPRREIDDPRLKKFGGVSKLISAEVFDAAFPWLQAQIACSPQVTLDIETSTPPESDDWLASQRNDEGSAAVDVFGSELTSLQLTFGANGEFSAYFPIDNIEEPDCHNITKDQLRQVLALHDPSKFTVIHNAGGFELPVLHRTLPLPTPAPWYGFVPNAIDTRLMAHYVDENNSTGLKKLSSRHLNYEQDDYKTTVTRHYTQTQWDARPLSSMGQRGTIMGEESGENGVVYAVEHKMNQLTAREVLKYGCDDTICTSALYVWLRVMMEIESTWNLYLQVEQFTSYVLAKSFNDGVDFSLSEMAAMEKDDDEAYEKAWVTLRQYLMDIGYDGTIYEPITDLTPASVKRMVLEITGIELKTKNRKHEKLVEDIYGLIDGKLVDDEAERLVPLVAELVREKDMAKLNELAKAKFKGEPNLNLGSPKQVAELLYDRIGIPITVINDLTDNEKRHHPQLAEAVARFKKKRAGKVASLQPGDIELLRSKVKTDEIAIQTAIAFDTDVLKEKDIVALKALGVMKKVMTRRSLFYKNYWSIKHWRDGKIHAGLLQCGTVTRRFTCSFPNLQQLPKKGEAVRFRSCFLPHKKTAVVCSIDYSGQELRLAAERSQDPNMLSCYVGDNLRDIHSLTAAFAMNLKWDKGVVAAAREEFGPKPEIMTTKEFDYHVFTKLRGMGKADPRGKKADDLRKDSKNVNFTAQFGGGAPKIADRLIMRLTDAMLFLDARNEMFPMVNEAAKRAEEFCMNKGYALTIGGGRRHLAEAINSSDRGEAARAARQAWNMEIQGSAGEMVKLGMSRLWLSGALHKYDARFMMQVHDELVTSVDKEHALEFIKIKHDCMVAPYFDMKVPILGSVSIGPDFAHQHECGDWFIAEEVTKALNDIFAKEAA